MFLKIPYRDCQGRILPSNPNLLSSLSNESEIDCLSLTLKREEWITLAVLLSFYLFLKSEYEKEKEKEKEKGETEEIITENFEYVQGQSSNLTINLRNGVNIPGKITTTKISNLSFAPTVPVTIFTVPTGKRFLVFQVITSLTNSDGNVQLQYFHKNTSSLFFQLSGLNNNQNKKLLFNQQKASFPINSSTSTFTTTYFNVLSPLVLFEEGESLVITSGKALVNVNIKYMYISIEKTDNVPIKSFFKTVIQNTSAIPSPEQVNSLFTPTNGPAVLLAPYMYVNPLSNLNTQPVSLSLVNNNSETQQYNNGVINYLNISNVTNPLLFVPYFYLIDDSGDISRLSNSFNPGFTNGNQMPFAALLPAFIPQGKTVFVDNRTINSWTSNQVGNFYGTYFEFI